MTYTAIDKTTNITTSTYIRQPFRKHFLTLFKTLSAKLSIYSLKIDYYIKKCSMAKKCKNIDRKIAIVQVLDRSVSDILLKTEYIFLSFCRC